jgi:hypothetical protein
VPPAVELPVRLLEALDDASLPGIRQGAARELGRILNGRNRALALAAERKLKELLEDDSLTVRQLAKSFLEGKSQAKQKEIERQPTPERRPWSRRNVNAGSLWRLRRRLNLSKRGARGWLKRRGWNKKSANDELLRRKLGWKRNANARLPRNGRALSRNTGKPPSERGWSRSANR